MTREFQRRMIDAEIAAQRDTARKLASALRRARDSAARARPICSGEDCERVFKSLIRPILIEREIAVHQLVAKRLSATLNPKPRERGAAGRNWEKAYLADNAAFVRQLSRIGLQTLKRAIQVTEPLAKSSPNARPLVDGLRRKMEARNSGVVPASDRPAFLVMGDQTGRMKDASSQ